MNQPDTALSFEDLEEIYTKLAETIDAVGPEREALFLAKLSLILAQRLGDREAVEQAIATALRDMG